MSLNDDSYDRIERGEDSWTASHMGGVFIIFSALLIWLIH